MSRRVRRRPWLVSVISPRTFFFAQMRVTRATPISRPGYPIVSRGWPPATTANTHLRPLLAGLAEFLLAAPRDVRLAGHGVRPRIRPIACADSSDFARNPAAGLSAISRRLGIA